MAAVQIQQDWELAEVYGQFSQGQLLTRIIPSQQAISAEMETD